MPCCPICSTCADATWRTAPSAHPYRNCTATPTTTTPRSTALRRHACEELPRLGAGIPGWAILVGTSCGHTGVPCVEHGGDSPGGDVVHVPGYAHPGTEPGRREQAFDI